MSDRDSPSIFDYLIVALNPALIMMLVGSLVFFLTDVFHQGSYETRLLFVFACYIFAMVLITRIAITQGRSYAFAYVVPLAVLTALALWQFVTYTGLLAFFGMPFSCLLLVLIWWSVDRLTWDCTFVDGSLDPSNEGLLQAAGVVDSDADEMADEAAEPNDSSPASESDAVAAPPKPARSANRPGVWIVYFSLAALPLFGIGGWFVPSDDLERRRYVFLLLAAYTFSGLGLMATTSLMGVREYLLSRSVSIRPRMMLTWLTLGAVAIVGVMIVAWMLPRRTTEYSLAPTAESRDAWEWNWAPGNDGKTSDPDGSTGEPEDKQGSQSDSGEAEGESNSKTDDGEEGSSQGESENDGGKSDKGESGDGESGEDESEQGEGESDSGEEGESNNNDSQSSENESNDSQNSDAGSPPPSDSSSFEFPDFSAIIALVSQLLKWAFFIAMVVVLAALAFRYRDDLIAGWKQWLARFNAWWKKWFGGSTPVPDASEPMIAAPAGPSFPAFANPFQHADHRSPDELIRYTFSALEAWGADHDCPRDVDETPFEYAEKIGARFPGMAESARLIAELYTQSLYAGVAATPNVAARLQQPWQAMTAI